VGGREGQVSIFLLRWRALHSHLVLSFVHSAYLVPPLVHDMGALLLHDAAPAKARRSPQ
jgi:hypothetical protein